MAESYVPVLKRRIVTADGTGHASKILTDDISNWARDQLIILLRKDAVNTVADQIRLDNPPAFASVDRTRGKPITQAVRRVEITFGSALKVAALNILVAELRRAIEASTTRRTGKLSDMSNWQWVYLRNGQRAAFPQSRDGGIPMGPRDAVILRPKLDYATIANMRIVHGGKGLTLKRTRQRSERATRHNQGLGFLAYAARRARRHSAFRGFNVLVKFTQHKVPGEISTRQGTGTIVITPQLGKRIWRG